MLCIGEIYSAVRSRVERIHNIYRKPVCYLAIIICCHRMAVGGKKLLESYIRTLFNGIEKMYPCFWGTFFVYCRGVGFQLPRIFINSSPVMVSFL